MLFACRCFQSRVCRSLFLFQIKPLISSKYFDNFKNLSNFNYQIFRFQKTSTLDKMPNLSEHIYTNDTPVVQLDVKTAFSSLNNNEKLYAHYLSKASWYGGLIVLFQTSPESPLIFTLFHKLFSTQSIDELKKIAQEVCEITDEEWRALLVYYAAFLSNMGNYRGFGDSKFIPVLPKEKLEKLIKNSLAYKQNSNQIDFLWDKVKEPLFSLNDGELSLGYHPKGITTYFSNNCTEEDAKIVKQLVESKKIEVWNARVFKNEIGYENRFASILSTEEKEDNQYLNISGDEKFKLTRGDYSTILSLVNKQLIQAQNHTSNELEKNMLEDYFNHFKNGSIDGHKDGSRKWIKNKGPIIETYIGFIESYRSPDGMRSEFEGFVALVNKEMSKKFAALVDNAIDFLTYLPWPKSFEKDKFLRPDFTSLEVLTFAGSGIPAGINIPNYDEIRQNEGFKNVSLGNVITASLKEAKPNYLSEEDAKMFDEYSVKSFEVQVGLHELLGHGSGKLFNVDESGKFNFDKDNTINPLTGKLIEKYYQPGETYVSKFSSLSSPYEECRAEVVGLLLSLEENILKVFGFGGEEAKNIIYVNWLSMVRAGIESLRMYQPATSKWLQSHCQARYVITRVLLESAKDLVEVKYIEEDPVDKKPNLLVKFTKDFNLINTIGRKAVSDFLLKLQVSKSTGDIEYATELFNKYSLVDDALEYPYLKFREIVVDRKKPRKIFVQSSTTVNNIGIVELVNYDSTHEGVIKSYLDHLNVEDLDKIVIDLWKKDEKFFN